MKINRAKLLADLSLVKAGLASKEMLEQSMSFVFEGGFVYTYNDEIAVSRPIDLDIKGAVSASELLGLLNKTKDEEVDIQVLPTGLQVSGKKFTAEIKLVADITLPINEIKPPDTWIPLPEKFAAAIKFCLFSTSKDMTKPALTCVHACNDRVESSDGFRLTRRYFDEKEYFKEPLLIPANAAQELTTFAAVEYGITPGWIHYITKDDTIFSHRTYGDLIFPSLGALMDLEGSEIKFPDDMQDMVARAAVFSATQLKVDERIKIDIAEGLLSIQGCGDAGRIEETTRVRFKGDACGFSISPAFLSDILDLTHNAIVGDNRLLFEEDDFVHVVALIAGE